MLLFQLVSAQYSFASVDQVITSREKELGKNVAVVIFKDGKTVYKKETGEDFKAETPEPIGASSKWLTAALVLSFVDEGKLSLDDPVSQYIPVFSTYSKSYITIRHCLSELTGIEPTQKKLDKLTTGKSESLEEEVNKYASKKEIINNPGKDFSYGSIGYNIAGRVLEVISKKKTFSRLMLERICKPLGMKKTSFMRESGAESPASGAVSTANDYLKFLGMLLNGGEVNGKKILSKQSVDFLLNPQTEGASVKFVPEPVRGYAYTFGGWVEETDRNGKPMVISSPGLFGTWPYIDKCRNYAAVIFTKQQGEQKKEPYMAIIDEINEQIKGDCN